MFPPVTGTRHSFQITPHSTCSAVWVRMSAWRRSQSIVAVDLGRPTAGSGPPSTACARRRRPPCARRRRRSAGERAGVVRLPTAGRVEGGAVEGDGTVAPSVHDRGRERRAGRRRGGTAARSPCRSCHGRVHSYTPRAWLRRRTSAAAIVGRDRAGSAACTGGSASPPASTTTIVPAAPRRPAPRGNLDGQLPDRRPAARSPATAGRSARR